MTKSEMLRSFRKGMVLCVPFDAEPKHLAALAAIRRRPDCSYKTDRNEEHGFVHKVWLRETAPATA